MSGRKVALVFPGQASHYVGMGKDLVQEFSEADAALHRAEESVDFPLRSLCFSGPEESLALTENQQPCVLAVSIAAYRVLSKLLQDKGIEIECVAGHSLGEYSALVAAKSLSFEDAVRLVRKRGQLMQQAVPRGVGGMSALIGRGPIDAKGLCEAVSKGNSDGCWPANFNSSGQVVSSGHLSALDRAKEKAKEFGARRVLPLAVSAPFHSPLMRPAAEKFADELAKLDIRPPAFDVFSNVTAEVHVNEADSIRTALIRQMDSPVLFESIGSKIAQRLKEELVIECGPKRVLAGLMAKIVPGFKVLSFGEPKDLQSIEEEIG